MKEREQKSCCSECTTKTPMKRHENDKIIQTRHPRRNDVTFPLGLNEHYSPTGNSSQKTISPHKGRTVRDLNGIAQQWTLPEKKKEGLFDGSVGQKQIHGQSSPV